MIPKINGKCECAGGSYKAAKITCVSNEFDPYVICAFKERMEKRGFEVLIAEEQANAEDSGAALFISKNEKLGEEAYILSIQNGNVKVEAADERGVIWALTTLYKRIGTDGYAGDCLIEDAPKMKHRGLHLDVARHFFDANEVKKIIEQISLAKMNVLHWHLSDDQGWRIESRKYPLLHETSGDYYTQEEIRDVVRFAKERGVEVIPEIDMPGHVRAILSAYPEYSCSGQKVRLAKAGGIYRVIFCAGNDKTYRFIEDLLDEICPLFPSARFHIGGDEAPKHEWKTCPVCQAKMKEEGISRYENLQGYFSAEIAKILKKHGKQPIVWNDSLESDILPEDMQMQYWSVTYNELSAEYVNKGLPWIYSDMFELYLDYPHAMTSVKKMYESRIDMGAVPIDGPGNLLGIEACIWTEHITENEKLEMRLFPRIYVAAELAWSGADDYSDFESRLIEETQRMEAEGISAVKPENWNPQGAARQGEAFGYMASLNGGIPPEDKDEVVDPSGVGADFQRKFMARFFREEDIPILMGSLNKQ